MTPRHRPRTYLADTVYEALRRAIVEHEFDAGEPLTEHELCRRFGTSRTPVREALAKLERDRLVQVVPKKGAFVRTISADEIRELYQLREALEGLAVRLAAPRVDREDLAGFEARFRAMKDQGKRATYVEVRTLGEEFHSFLIKQAGNAKLQEALAQIRGRFIRGAESGAGHSAAWSGASVQGPRVGGRGLYPAGEVVGRSGGHCAFAASV